MIINAQQMMACHKNKSNTTWSNYSGFAQEGVGGQSGNHTTDSVDSKLFLDDFAFTALCLMLPSMATSLFVVSFSWRVSEKKEKEEGEEGKEGVEEGVEGEGQVTDTDQAKGKLKL